MKIQLPNDCSCSKPYVSPANWQTKNPKMSSNWFIRYRFYAVNSEKPIQVVIKGMNIFKSVVERQNETQRMLAEELSRLKEGYNPISKAVPVIADTDSISFNSALNTAYEKLSLAEATKRDIKFMKSLVKKAATKLGFSELKLSEITKKHIKLILDEASNSNDRFNKNRSYLMILYSILTELELVTANYVKDIKKKKVIKKIRQTLTPEERIMVNEYLKNSYPEFYRFLHIFFHSGARISELIRIKEADVDLKNQRFKVLILKGAVHREVWKTIKDIAMPFWIDLMKDCQHKDCLFSKGLKPGKTMIKSYQIDKRWRRLVKLKLGITADFYSLKHLHTTEVVDLLNDVEAAKHNSHNSTNMVNQIYDVKSNERLSTSIKKLDNKFA